MFPRYLLISQLSLLWLLLSAVTQASPQLSGIATHSELGQEQFLAALYSETLSKDADLLLNTQDAKRMELKILAREGIAPRRFTRMWIEGAAINMPAGAMNSHAENMLAFDQLFRGRLEMNDHLIFDFSPQQGTVIHLNSVHLGTIENPSFFDVLLRTWIGNVPLSSGYREALLMEGNIDAALLQRFTHMEPRLSRIAVVKNWNETILAAASAASSANSSSDNRGNISDNNSKKIAAVSSVKSSARQSGIALTNQSSLPGATQVAGATASITESTNASTIAPDAPAVNNTGDNADDALSQLTAQSLVAQQYYISDAMRRIYAQLIYPRRARELQQTGSIKIRIAVDAAGNITALQPLETSEHRLLNQAVESAIKASAPFPPLPPEITAQQLEFAVPITFTLGQS
ncbi:TonB family C-terminal domain protein [Cellvibrio sp. BR]|uniref:TonB family protein n=1 Tax=Cellvibrio sp. BR TaxID=1134474 RepID=UPI0002601324|nr:TonB family protein [Cellvibrio sp. BR]EIK43721.1 TonB family C-terminal domain protein [Cellvibrio sp. BR]